MGEENDSSGAVLQQHIHACKLAGGVAFDIAEHRRVASSGGMPLQELGHLAGARVLPETAGTARMTFETVDLDTSASAATSMMVGALLVEGASSLILVAIWLELAVSAIGPVRGDHDLHCSVRLRELDRLLRVFQREAVGHDSPQRQVVQTACHQSH